MGEPGRFTFPYLQLGSELGADLGSWPVPHYGRLPALTLVGDGVTTLATRTDPVLETDQATYWHNNQPAPGIATNDPVIVERAVGDGRVIVSVARLGNNRARLGNGAYRDLLATLVRRAAGESPEVELLGANHNTELVVTHRADETVLHLVTGYPVVALDLYGAQQPAAIEDVARLQSLQLRVPSDTRSVVRILDGAEIPLELRGEPRSRQPACITWTDHVETEYRRRIAESGHLNPTAGPSKPRHHRATTPKLSEPTAMITSPDPPTRS